MSPVSRGRKGKRNKKSTSRAAGPDLLDAQDACDCPACSGEGFDPRPLIDELTTVAAGVAAAEDPLYAEMMGASFLSIGEIAGEAFEEALVGGFIPMFEARASTEALAMLLAIGSVAEGRAAKAASAAADRLADAGVPGPEWAAELAEPVTVADGWRLTDSQDTASVLACSFHRAGRSHAVTMSVDHRDCGAASEILLFEADQLPEALETIQADHREALDPAELRWHVENALDARAVHDSDRPALGTDDVSVDHDDVPNYRAMAVLLRARISALPAPDRSKAAHRYGDGGPVLPTALDMLAQLARSGGGPFGAGTAVAVLPAKRKKSEGPAPVFQIKVGLRGAKPPIWRRLEVPADISLARLHEVIQIAFDWYDCHLHVFETPYGQFGTADSELGHRAEAPVTLEQVAPGVRSKIRYTYDFGDDWEHDILVEKLLDRDKSANYPRCTGGRRAAPPEDCGGIWGYADLEEILADPGHPDHEDRLEWLGLDDAAEFDPDGFDANAVTQALSRLR